MLQALSSLIGTGFRGNYTWFMMAELPLLTVGRRLEKRGKEWFCRVRNICSVGGHFDPHLERYRWHSSASGGFFFLAPWISDPCLRAAPVETKILMDALRRSVDRRYPAVQVAKVTLRTNCLFSVSRRAWSLAALPDSKWYWIIGTCELVHRPENAAALSRILKTKRQSTSIAVYKVK